MSNARQNTAKWFPHIRLPFEGTRVHSRLVWELPIYTFVHRMTPPSPGISTPSSRSLPNLVRKRDYERYKISCSPEVGAKKVRTVEMLVGRPRSNHFARPTMLSGNLELCISPKTNRIFACGHAGFLHAPGITPGRDTSSKGGRARRWYTFGINVPVVKHGKQFPIVADFVER